MEPTPLARRRDAEQAALRAAEASGTPFLLWRDGDGGQQILALHPTQRALTVGRRVEADVSLPWDPEVSRLHAELSYKAGEWTIEDDGWSQNGTFVNEVRVEGRRRLADGDLLRAGRTSLEYRDPSAGAVGVTLLPGELGATPRFSEQQQSVLRALCRPLFLDGEGVEAATEEEVARECRIAPEVVHNEIDHLVRALGLEALPTAADRRAEIALLAVRSGLVKPEDLV